jgi:hypothetical protein
MHEEQHLAADADEVIEAASRQWLMNSWSKTRKPFELAARYLLD